jgi:regulator of protease activity HflC (stomatin/prohibitin superfamily)
MSAFDHDYETEPEPALGERLVKRLDQVQLLAYSALALLLIVLGVIWPRTFIFVPAGHQAVMFRFAQGGVVTDRIWGEGIHVIPPWDTLTDYDCRLQEQTLELEVLSLEGIDMGVTVSVRYRPNLGNLGYLHRDIGQEYFDKLVAPEVKAHIRRTFGERPALEIYSNKKDLLQELSRVPLLGRVEPTELGLTTRNYVDVEELKLLDIELPDIVEAAIADKYRQEQLMLEYQYKIHREEKEADRKRIEAAGIRDYTDIAGEISEDVLRWRGLDANLELASSTNSKVVIFGGGDRAAPMLLNLGPDDAPPRTDQRTGQADQADASKEGR